MRPSEAPARRRSCRRLPSCGAPCRGKCRPARDAVPRYRLCLLTVALAVSGCGGPFPQSTLEPRSDFGWAIDHLFTDIFWWAAGVFLVVETLLVVTLIRFRHREGRPPPRPTHGHTVMEIAWTLAPAVILVFVAVPTVRTIFATAAEAPADALKVDVIGHQWWWEFRYPELGLVTANELHLPLGRSVQLSITSADVIHSFWAPTLGGKRDAIPGRINRIAFRADSMGDYSGQCAEFCGESHANMRLRVVVDSDSGFARSACLGCHTIQGVSPGIIGPNLTHVGSRTTLASGLFPNDSAHLASWIADAPALKPGSLMMRMQPPLTDADIAALVAYLEGLR